MNYLKKRAMISKFKQKIVSTKKMCGLLINLDMNTCIIRPLDKSNPIIQPINRDIQIHTIDIISDYNFYKSFTKKSFFLNLLSKVFHILFQFFYF